MPPQEERPGLISIERVVAFVVGPALTALAGWLSVFVAKKWGIKLDPAAITGIFATGGFTAAGLVYKWLHGRQLEMGIEGSKLIEELRSSPAEGFIATTARDLEGVAQAAALKAVQSVTGQGQVPPTPAVQGPDEANE